MPCTYCGSNIHTRAKCDKIEKDFKTYEKVSVLAREKYINTLLEKGINPGALVRTYNRTNNFMQKFSQSRVSSLGSLDVFSHYKKIGRSISSIYIESQELIELDDDNEALVSVKHCYEVVESSTSEWDATGSWTQTQLLGFDEFKNMFKGKKRHPAFTGEFFGCIVKELTAKKETPEEIAVRVGGHLFGGSSHVTASADREEELEGDPIYVVTAISTSDDYKRAHTSSETKTAGCFEDARSIAIQMYLERVTDYDLFEYNEDLLDEFKSVMEATSDLLDTCYNFFDVNQDSLFSGEYVPKTFEVDIAEQKTSTASILDIDKMLEEILGTP